jgi:hypothetical protein
MALFFEIFSWGFCRPYSNPDFAPLEAAESNHACPPEMAAKLLDLNTALIFLGTFLHQGKKVTMPRLTSNYSLSTVFILIYFTQYHKSLIRSQVSKR